MCPDAMKRLYSILCAMSVILLFAGSTALAQTPAEKMKAKVDSLREAARRQDQGSLKEIDPRMDAAVDSILSIPVDSSVFKGSKFSLTAMDIEDFRRQGRLYAEEYDFEEALNSYEKALALCRDSALTATIREEMVRCENGQKMMDYCCKPQVVAKRKFALREFFLYYPLRDYSWRPCPNQLDPDGGQFSRALYYPDFSREIIFSARGEDGTRDLAFTRQAPDGFWERPAGVDSLLTSPEDEIYPIICGDKLFFASKGLYGMGGYDLYVSDRDPETGTWGVPKNLGFPFNSPYDDFLFINTDDGRYSLFASNRECSRDSVYIYVLEYDPMPVRSAIDNASDLYRLCKLRPSYDLKRVDNSDAMSVGQADEKTLMYMEQVAAVRALRDTISMKNRELDELRARYNAVSDWQRVNLAAEISQQEMELLKIQKKLDAAGRELQKTEMQFLLSGVVLDAGRAVAEADQYIVGADQSYTFTRKNLGEPFSLELRPVPIPTLPELEIPEIEEAEP